MEKQLCVFNPELFINGSCGVTHINSSIQLVSSDSYIRPNVTIDSVSVGRAPLKKKKTKLPSRKTSHSNIN